MTWNDRRKGWIGRTTEPPYRIEYRTVHEAALILHRTPRTIRRWLTDPSVFPKAKKVKDGWMIPLSDIERVFRSPDDYPA